MEKSEKKDALLKREIRLKNRKIKYPTKTTINMMNCGLPQKTGKKLTIGFLAIALLLVFVVKFGVYDQFARLENAENAYNEVHVQNEALSEKLKDYSQVQVEYRAYSMNFVTEEGEDRETIVMVDRKDILNLIEAKMQKKGEIRSITVSKNTVVVNMSGMNLKQISEMLTDLKESPIVADVQLKIAQTEEEKKASILNFTVTIFLQAEEA